METAYCKRDSERRKPLRPAERRSRQARRSGRRRPLFTLSFFSLIILLLACAVIFSQKVPAAEAPSGEDGSKLAWAWGSASSSDAEAHLPADKAEFPAADIPADKQELPIVDEPPAGEAELPIVSPPQDKATPDDAADDAWKLRLVNPQHSLPENYSITLTELRSGQSVDERAYPDLQQMMDDCRAAGLKPLICSSFRTWKAQEQLYNKKVNRLMQQGYSSEDAKTEAARVVAVPGTSEHQLGLALDIVDTDNQNLDSTQENTPVQKWLMENSWKYGYILRYPEDKSDITGIIYEPWHYRYVGIEAAKEIYEGGLCLEEYLSAS